MSSIALTSKFILKHLAFWLIAWGVSVCAYVFSLQNGLMLKGWDYLVYLLQLNADIAIGVLGYLAYKAKAKKTEKIFYLLVFASIIPGLFANEIYNLLINIIDISRTENKSLYWSFAYTLFLLIQCAAWCYLLYNKISTKQQTGNRWLTIYPYIQSSLIIFLSLTIIVVIKSGTAAQINQCRIMNSLLEIVVFTLMSMSFSRTKNKSLIYLEIGFLLLIGFNFAHRFSDMMSAYYKAFDVIWLICLVVIIYGLYMSTRVGNKKIQFFEENSIHVLTSGAFILFANFILVIFISIAFGLSMLQIDKMPNLRMLLLDIPSALVFSFSLTVLLAKLLAWRLSQPLDRVIDKIGKLAENQVEIKPDEQNEFQIHEVQTLETFICKKISELQYANQAKSQFLMNMSHDFRTPASGVMHMSRLVCNRMPEGDLKRLQKMVVNSSEQLMDFLDDVLDYSSLEYGAKKSENEYLNIVKLINELIEFNSAKAYENNLEIRAHFQHDSIVQYGDRTTIKKIILNLISNAIKFTHSGNIQVFVLFEVIDHKKWLLIKIKDTGVGIDKNNHNKIFEPFYRVEAADSAKYSGVGLGLSNVKLMLKQIGGMITLESELGCGSEFSAYLPKQ